jgi:hypothetical protein
MNQLNNGKAVNPPAEPMKCAKNRFKIGEPKSNPLVNVPIRDIATAMTIIHLFERSNFFSIPIRTNAKPANAKMSTQKSISPPSIGKTSHLPKRVPQRNPGSKISKILTKTPNRYSFTPLFIITSH